MAETVALDRPTVAKPATVSSWALALHLDCSGTYIGKLEAEGVIQRQGDGYQLGQSRVAYLPCDTCGVSGANRRAARLRQIMSGSKPRCCNCG